MRLTAGGGSSPPSPRCSASLDRKPCAATVMDQLLCVYAFLSHARTRPCAAPGLYMLGNGLRMAGARLHLKGGGGASKQRGCGLRCPHTKMQLERRRRPGRWSLGMRLVNAIGKSNDPTTDAATRMEGPNSIKRDADSPRRAMVVRRVSRAQQQQTIVVVARAHMAVAGWSHAQRDAARMTGRTVPNRRMYPGQALNQPRWQQAGLPQSSQGIGEHRVHHAGPRAGVDKCGPRDDPVVAVLNRRGDRPSIGRHPIAATPYIYTKCETQQYRT
jgi:hypothetical protein